MQNHFETERKELVKKLLRDGYISKDEVIKAMEKVPREKFLPKFLENQSYDDTPLQIGEGQTISAPHMVGIMVENLDLEKGHKVLEIGTGSGYHACVVAEIIGNEGKIYSVELYETLGEKAKKVVQELNYKNVFIFVGDGSKGLKEFAPYDRIYVTCASPKIPFPLVEQLKENGKMLIPVGNRWYQELIKVEKKDNKIKKKNLGGCIFVPLRGE